MFRTYVFCVLNQKVQDLDNAWNFGSMKREHEKALLREQEAAYNMENRVRRVSDSRDVKKSFAIINL